MTRRGLTFVELLVAVTIAALLMTGLAAHLQGGIAAWRRAHAGIEELERWQTMRDRLTLDAANAVPVEPSPDTPPTVWQDDVLQFYTAQPASGVWLVRYEIERLPEGPVLVRRAATLQDVRAGTPLRTQRLLPGVTALAARYGCADAGERRIIWQQRWDVAGRWPALIDLTVERMRARPLHHRVVVPGGLFDVCGGTG